MRSTLVLVALCLLLAAAPAFAEPPVADRARILHAELTRHSVDLEPYLGAEEDPALRRLALRALGRIGDDGHAVQTLQALLASETKEPALVLWAAGITRDKRLAQPLADQLARHLAAKEIDLAAQAARALGRVDQDGAVAPKVLEPLLDHPSAVVRAAALVGLSRAGVSDRAVLQRATALGDDADAGVRVAADLACWRLAARARRDAKKADPGWDGDAALAAPFVARLGDAHAARRLGAVRVLAPLMPAEPAADGPFARALALVDDPDVHVVEDTVARVLKPRHGAAVDAALVRALAHADPKVRAEAATALGAHGTAEDVKALAARWAVEPDARLRDILAVELVRNGKEDYAGKLLARDDRPKDPVVRQETEAELLLVSKRPGALDELLRWADPGASQRGGLHAATWLTILGGLEGREDPKLDPWLMGFLAGGYGIDRLERPYVVSEAVSLIGRNHRFGLARALLDLLKRAWAGPPPHDEIRQQALHVEVRKALMDAFADLAGATGCPPEIAAAMLAALRKHMLRDPSPWVRRKAREAARTLGLKDVPERDEVGQPNAWRGIPRVVETTGEDGEPQRTTHWLHEDEIVVLADLLAAAHARVVFETSVGPFTVALDPEDAPAHCVSLVTAVANGIYRHTRWHRVVPDFVIQGGDPHGTGAGDGGWTVPDEITRHPFVRGALGMPKSTKDDGGCQIFVMHAAYPPLDGRYTCYGQVTDGMDAVDAIRVGDFLLSARVVLGGR